MRVVCIRFAVWLLILSSAGRVVAQRAGTGINAVLVEREKTVEAQVAKTAWREAQLGLALALGDRLRTGEYSRAALRFSDTSMLRVDELTTVEITPPVGGGKRSLEVESGGAYFFSRDPAPEIEIRTPVANGALRGTEFELRVGAGGRTRLTMFDGEVEIGNALGRISVRSGEQAIIEAGRAPRKTPMIDAANLIQWCLYYPAILDPADLGAAGAAGEMRSRRALDAYAAGDLRGAAETFDLDKSFASTALRAFRANLILATGQVAKAKAVLAGVPAGDPRRRALEQMIAAVTLQPWSRTGEAATSSEWLADSYYEQSRGHLENALRAAQRATELSPGFGYAWARVAELEFSFGRTPRAMKLMERSLELAPKNAQSHALQGFLLSAENRIGAARRSFETAIDLDGALGNAWLGRGLTFFRQGDEIAGRHDLQTAAVLEPNRAIFRSYLGKAFSIAGIAEKANLELDRAKQIDPQDPTPWLYSALQRKQENRYNEAIDELEKSLELNENRRVYRGRFLLDQDRAVRSTNLAAIYRNNGMVQQSIREAVRAVSDDYSSAGAHLFLANSYDALRDPNRILLRYETTWSNELLLSQLLAPVGAGSLSQFVSQQEYSKLFEGDGLGLSSFSEYRSTGDLVQTASQFGTFGNVSYALDGFYRYSQGIRPNNRFQQQEAVGTFKLQLGPQDSVFLQARFDHQRNGFVSQLYDQRDASRVLVPGFDERGEPVTTAVPNRTLLSFTNRETQDPGLLLAGWNRQWSPGNHTLLLVGRLASRQEVKVDQNGYDFLTRQLTFLLPPDFPRNERDATGRLTPRVTQGLQDYLGRGSVEAILTNAFDTRLFTGFETYTAELQQIATAGPMTAILGGRYQQGRFETRLALKNFNDGTFDDELRFFTGPKITQSVLVDFERLSLYLYDTLRLTSWLSITGGISYDRVDAPENVTRPPVNDRQQEIDRFSPKASFLLEPWRGALLRGVYAKATSGAAFDESVRLEPAQLAGFVQASRSFAPETIVGTSFANDYRFYGLSFEQKLPTRTYLGVQYDLRLQESPRVIGVFDTLSYNGSVLVNLPSSLDEKNSYREEVFTASLNQLVGRDWSLGATYRHTESRFRRRYPAYEDALDANRPTMGRLLGVANVQEIAVRRTEDDAALHELSLTALYNHPSGLFARAEANWFQQENDSYRILTTPRTIAPVRRRDYRFSTQNLGLAGAEFWQFNLLAGYRFYRNQGEVTLGVLNLGDTDYRLNPLSPYEELPRERTFVARVRLNF